MHESTRRYIQDLAIAQGYDRTFADSPLFAYDTSVLTRWLKPPARVIDLGCGTGRHLLSLAHAGCQILGVDLSEHMLACARQKLAAANLHAQLLQLDLTQLPLDNPRTQGILPALPRAQGILPAIPRAQGILPAIPRAQGILPAVPPTHPNADTVLPADLLAPASFDHAICMFSTLGLFHTATARHRFLQATRRLLRLHGTLALHVHNYWSNLFALEGLAFLLSNALQTLRRHAELGDKIIPNYRGIARMYIHVFRPRELRHLLQTNGFEILEWINLNRPRNAPLPPGRLTPLRANGFLVQARRLPP